MWVITVCSPKEGDRLYDILSTTNTGQTSPSSRARNPRQSIFAWMSLHASSSVKPMHGIRRKEGSTYILHFFELFSIDCARTVPNWAAPCIYLNDVHSVSPSSGFGSPAILCKSTQKGNPLHTKQMRAVIRALVPVITLKRAVVFHCEKCPAIQSPTC